LVDSDVIVADSLDGKPLDAQHGRFQLVAPHDQRLARSVRMLLQSLTVARHEWI
jgi:hypothetical protein